MYLSRLYQIEAFRLSEGDILNIIFCAAKPVESILATASSVTLGEGVLIFALTVYTISAVNVFCFGFWSEALLSVLIGSFPVTDRYTKF